MKRKLVFATPFCRFIVLVAFTLLAPLSSFGEKNGKAQKSAGRAESCLKLGQGDIQSGLPGESILPVSCCKSLKDREPKDVCGIPTGGGYQYLCLACGDGKCDHELENTCNCSEDCK